MKLNTGKFALAAGILWGLSLFVFTFIGIYFNYGHIWLNLMGDVYPGYELTPKGAVIGLIYGFLDGYIGTFIFAWIYNKLVG